MNSIQNIEYILLFTVLCDSVTQLGETLNTCDFKLLFTLLFNNITHFLNITQKYMQMNEVSELFVALQQSLSMTWD